MASDLLHPLWDNLPGVFFLPRIWLTLDHPQADRLVLRYTNQLVVWFLSFASSLVRCWVLERQNNKREQHNYWLRVKWV